MFMIETAALLKPETHEEGSPQTRVITLNYGENLKELVFRLHKGSSF